MAAFVLVTFILIPMVCSSTVTSTNVEDKGDNVKFRIDDPQRCQQRSLNKNLKRYEVLPGGGWDNLRNRNAGQVISYNYSLCDTTTDGQYLLPDGVYTVALKESKLETYAEMFEHWKNYTTTTSSTINAEAGLHIGHFGIGGSFSHESEHVRSSQVMDDSVTVRVQLRYTRYSAKLQPDTEFNPAFKTRLLTIASQLAKNQKEMARYESQLLVRDFGTHVITSVDAGATLVQLDQVKTTFVRHYSMDRNKVKASASASFCNVFSIGGSYQKSTTKEMIDQYLGNRTHSATETYGGSNFKPENFSLNDWSDTIADNLVPLDRAGDPLHFLITPFTLPGVPSSVVYELIQEIKNAIDLYYKHNVYKGCTVADSPNFSFQANVDDGSCQNPYNNYTFGGVYQTCSMSGNVRSDTCRDLVQKNPITGDFKCPDNYEAVLLDQGAKTTPNTVHRCRHCGLFGWSRCCGDYSSSQTASYKGYWCVATGKVDDRSGYLFGGLYTSTIGNPLTGARSCPPYFYPLKISSNLQVCVSDDYELGFRYSVPFAGFFSCQTGNPLKLSSDEEIRHKRSSADGNLETFLMVAGATHWPRGCPSGYSEHLATVSHGCEVSYCIQAHALGDKGLPKIKRPPFMEIPVNEFGDNSTVMISYDGQAWTSLEEPSPDINTEHQSNQDAGSDNSGLSRGSVAVIAIFATIACIMIVSIIAYKIRNSYRPTSEYRRQESDPLVPNRPVEYGSSDQQTEVEIET